MIFEPLVQKGYEWINCVNDVDYQVFAAFDGAPRANGWRRVLVRTVRADSEQECKTSDFPWFGGHALVFRKRAISTLRQMLERSGELLPLANEDGTELFVLNVTNVIDALDKDMAEIVRYPKSDRIMHIRSVAFVEELVRDVDIFRLPHRGSSVYLSSRFVTAVREGELRGLEFKQVWPRQE